MANKTNPQYFVDITDTYDTKIKMMKCHASQVGAWSADAFGVSYLDMIDAETKFYCAACGTPGCKRVEAFSLATDWPIIAGAHLLLP